MLVSLHPKHPILDLGAEPESTTNPQDKCAPTTVLQHALPRTHRSQQNYDERVKSHVEETENQIRYKHVCVYSFSHVLLNVCVYTCIQVDLPNGPTNNFRLDFKLINPKGHQPCQTIMLKISMKSCLGSDVQTWPGTNDGSGELLAMNASLGAFASSQVSSSVITRGVANYCPLFIRTNAILVKDVSQSSGEHVNVCIPLVCM